MRTRVIGGRLCRDLRPWYNVSTALPLHCVWSVCTPLSHSSHEYTPAAHNVYMLSHVTLPAKLGARLLPMFVSAGARSRAFRASEPHGPLRQCASNPLRARSIAHDSSSSLVEFTITLRGSEATLLDEARARLSACWLISWRFIDGGGEGGGGDSGGGAGCGGEGGEEGGAVASAVCAIALIHERAVKQLHISAELGRHRHACKECGGARLGEHGKHIGPCDNSCGDLLLPLQAGAAILAAALPALRTPLAVLADARAAAVLALVALPAVLADACAAALLAHRSLPAVLADSCATAVPAPRAPPAVLADARPAALLAPRALLSVLADTCATAVLAPRALPAVLADAGAAAVLATRTPPAVLADARAAALLALRLPPTVRARHLACGAGARSCEGCYAADVPVSRQAPWFRQTTRFIRIILPLARPWFVTTLLPLHSSALVSRRVRCR